MPLTVADARNHIRDTLGDQPAPEIPVLMLVNEAGRFLCGMHSWRFLDRRTATLGFGRNQTFVVLPDDVARVQNVYVAGTMGMEVELTSLEEVQRSRVQGLSGGNSYFGAITRRRLPAPNLLAYSDAFNQPTAWAYSDGTGSITADTAVNPYTGEQTADTVTDNSAVAVSTLTQTIPTHLLADGPYTLSSVLRPSPVTAVSPAKTGLVISSEAPLSSGLITQLEIQWGATPWSNAPTALVVGTNTGEAELLDPVPRGEGFWEFILSGYQFTKAANYGRILVGLQPSRAEFGDASGTETITSQGAVDVVRMQLNEGYAPATYVAQGATAGRPRRIAPVLELDRAPSATGLDQLTLIYRGSWVDVNDDEDELPLPGTDYGDEYCNLLYIQILRALARGWDEEGNGTADGRLDHIRRGPIFAAAAQTDGLFRAKVGRMGKGTATDVARANTGIGTLTDFDSYAGPQ
jgi:hypothetical protein